MRPRSTSLFVTALLLLAGCTGMTRGQESVSGRAVHVAMDRDEQTALRQGDDRLLVRSASLTLEVEHVGPVEAEIVAHTRRAGGFVEQSSRQDDDLARFTLRVPAATLEATLDSLGRLGRVRDRAIGASDVTADARDLDARIANLRATRDRLRLLVERAADVGDIAAVERELGRVQGELDALEARQKGLRSDIALARVTVEVRRRRVLGPLGLALAGLAWAVEKLFVLR